MEGIVQFRQDQLPHLVERPAPQPSERIASAPLVQRRAPPVTTDFRYDGGTGLRTPVAEAQEVDAPALGQDPAVPARFRGDQIGESEPQLAHALSDIGLPLLFPRPKETGNPVVGDRLTGLQQQEREQFHRLLRRYPGGFPIAQHGQLPQQAVFRTHPNSCDEIRAGSPGLEKRMARVGSAGFTLD
ncbi:hypothetical protein ACFQ2M_31275 [Kitasatospora saccharophila]|uniref:hypothetical protein n=1 Tax=Kitasatospora saccharophila TaxID=407973 RepID=UPI0031D41C3E